jgi:hypothetical protein
MPGKSRAYAGKRSFTFFIFLGTVLPFFYFSVVRKVPEKPVLFLPHPPNCGHRNGIANKFFFSTLNDTNLGKIAASRMVTISVTRLGEILPFVYLLLGHFQS